MSAALHRRPSWAMLLLAGCALPLLAWHPLRSRVGEVEEGNAALAAGDTEAALQAYERAGRRIPENPTLLYDRGLAYLAAKKLDEAADALGKAVHSPEEEVRYRAYFALGLVRYQQEDWAAAVEAFKAGLKLRPEDDDVRLNYELAWFKLHPPCRLREDTLEENDTPETAKVLEKVPEEPLRACPGDADWYAVDVPAGASLFITAKVVGDPAPLLLALLSPSGEPLQEARGEQELAVEQRLAPESGRYRFRVLVEGQAEPSYELGIDVVPPCPLGNDGFEPNDGPAQAHTLVKGDQQGLRICPGDQDWYAVSLAKGEKLAATLQFPAVRGPLQVTLLTGDGQTVLATGSGGPGQAMAALTEPRDQDGPVLVKISGGLQGVDNRYDLKLSDEPPPGDDQQNQQQDDKQDQQQDDKQDGKQDDKQDGKQDDKQDQKQDGKQDEKQDQPQQQPQAGAQPVPLDRQAMERALDALQGEDRNVQLDKLLRALPDQRVEKDW